MKHTHILIIRFSALGDVAMTVPIVWALAQQYPDVRITVLSRPVSRTLFEDLAPNVNFMEADLKGEYHGVKGLNALFRRLVAKRFTHIADLHSVLRSEYLRMRFNLGLYRVEHINKHRHQRRQLVAPQPRKVLQQLPTSFQNYLDVFSRLGFPIATSRYCFRSIFEPIGPISPIGPIGPIGPIRPISPISPTPPSRGNLNLLPKAIGPKRSWEQWIGIAPFAAHKGKVYPQEKMEQVIERLTQQYPKARLFLFGRGKDEDLTFPHWAERWPQCTIVSWHTETLYQELILMSHLDVMLSMDSANQHLASLTATPVVSVWGATHPYAGFMGWRQDPQNAIQLSDLPCRPCSIYGQKPCQRGDYACLNGIAPEMILERMNQILTKNQQEV